MESTKEISNFKVKDFNDDVLSIASVIVEPEGSLGAVFISGKPEKKFCDQLTEQNISGIVSLCYDNLKFPQHIEQY